VLVTVKGLGSIWERRFRRGAADDLRYDRAAFYNTTGVFVNGSVRYRWRIGGKIRFNGAGGFTPCCPRQSVDRVFECGDPEISHTGWTQILFKRMLSGPQRPDFYLFVVTGETTGRLDVTSACWKAGSVQVVALSESCDQHEAMLLMPPYSWVRSELGTYFVEPSQRRLWSADLRLDRVD
jgi:hypothetical protein